MGDKNTIETLIGSINLLTKQNEKAAKRSYILIIVLCTLLAFTTLLYTASVKYCLDIFNSYEYATTVTTYEQDGDGTNVIGDVINSNILDTIKPSQQD